MKQLIEKKKKKEERNREKEKQTTYQLNKKELYSPSPQKSKFYLHWPVSLKIFLSCILKH